jgi:capsular exopolysaccharide synthesis family protein
MATPSLITLSDPRSAAAEAYRTLRTNLMFSSVEHPITTLLIAAPERADDKSMILANLAITFAQGGNTTILVDADLRRPQQHTIWGCSNDVGLTTLMLDARAMSNPPLVQTPVEGLSLLPSGALPPIPSDVLSSQRMSEVIGVLKARASYVIFDAPPVLAATDAALLGAKLDGVALIAKAGATRRDQVARAVEALERVHVRVLGAVLTNAPRENSSNYR